MKNGFTLLEVLLVIAGLTILLGISISAINPIQRNQESRDDVRRIDVQEIQTAVNFYRSQKGTYPANIPELDPDIAPNTIFSKLKPILHTQSTTETCGDSKTSSENYVDLDKDIIRGQIGSIPADPQIEDDSCNSGYRIGRIDDQIIVQAETAENVPEIRVD